MGKDFHPEQTAILRPCAGGSAIARKTLAGQQPMSACLLCLALGSAFAE